MGVHHVDEATEASHLFRQQAPLTATDEEESHVYFHPVFRLEPPRCVIRLPGRYLDVGPHSICSRRVRNERGAG